MKKTKRIWSLLLICCLLAALMPMRADAAETEGTEGDFDYSYGLNGMMITAYHGSDEQVIVPATIAGYPVYGLEPGAFSNNETMRELTLSEGIQLLPAGNPAIVACSALETLRLPASISIGGGFAGADYFIDACYAMKEVLVAEENSYYKTDNGVLMSKDGTILIYCPPKLDMTDYVIPEGVTTIQSDAFEYNLTIKKVTLPSTLLSIGYWAFNNSNLEEIELNEGLQFIGQYAFQSTMLSTITLPSTLTKIIHPAFDSYVLESISVADENPVFFSDGGILYQHIYNEQTAADELMLVRYPLKKQGASYIMPENVGAIADCAFFGAEDLELISLNTRIKELPNASIWNCYSLKNITIPQNVTLIDDNFGNCNNLQWIFIEGNSAIIEKLWVGPETGLVICGNTGSTAEAYAKEYGYTFLDCDQASFYQLQYASNGGSGEMCVDTAISGVSFRLPENGFTAPEGMTFRAWSINGEERAPGESVFVDADTTVIALWEEKVEIQVVNLNLNAEAGTLTGTVRYESTLEGTDTVFIVAFYNESGQMLGAWTKTVPLSNEMQLTVSGEPLDTDQAKLFIVQDGSWIPLCAATEIT